MGGPRASLTFDDGPHPQTEELLAVLDSHGVRATFFQCGMYVQKRPALALLVASRHEIGNHTQTHPWLWRQGPDRIWKEVQWAQDSILDATGIRAEWFRPPYGIGGWGLSAALKEFGLNKVLWTVIGKDWVLPGQQIARRVLANLADESVICLHDGRDVNPKPDIRATIEAVRIVIPEMKARGFVFETLSERLWRQKTLRNA
jgi:peptidoglycan/xylan/chitin deacetylase (PgdA/CDA1 family)